MTSPTLTVEPSTDLVDGQRLHVTGRGYGGVGLRPLVQCPSDAVTWLDCDPYFVSASVENGNLDGEFRVRAILELPGRTVDCRQPDACVLGVSADLDEQPLLTRAPLPFDPDGSLAPPPTLSVTPSEKLRDGQTVTVTGTGFVRFPGMVSIEVAQCVAGFQGWEDCDHSTSRFVDSDGDGGFSASRPVYSLIYLSGGRTIDCRVVGRCVLAATSNSGSLEEVASTGVRFRSHGRLRPLPAITVAPGDDLVDGQTVQVDGRAFDRNSSGLVRFYWCAPAPSVDACGNAGAEPVPVADDGTFSAEVQAFARFGTPGGAVDCRAGAAPCLLIASTDLGESDGFLESPLAGRAELDFDPEAPLLAGPEITVTPTTNLHDFNTLSVRGRHISAGGQVRVEVCEAADRGRCDSQIVDGVQFGNAESATADANGEFALDFTGWAGFQPGWPVDCRQAPGCAVVATDQVRGLSATVPLGFGPPDPPRGRYLDPVFEDVQVDEGVPYRQTTDHLGNPVELKLDIYRPAGDTATSRPTILLLHGGWFSFGDRGSMAPYAEEYARRGYAAVSLQYRLRPGVGSGDLPQLYLAMLDAYEDATEGVEWLEAHAAELGIDPDAIVASGYSAGAVTASNLAYLPGQVGPATSRVAAALPMSGWFLDPDTPGLPIPGPLARPDAGEPPAIVFHGTEDQLLPIGSPADLCPLAHEAGIACEYIGYEGAGHEVGDASRQSDIIRRGTDFLAEHVLGPQGRRSLPALRGCESPPLWRHRGRPAVLARRSSLTVPHAAGGGCHGSTHLASPCQAQGLPPNSTGIALT